MFGHGSAVDAHTNFGNQAARISSPVRRPDLQAKLKAYNVYHEGKNLQIKYKEVNGRYVLEGALRVHWGVQRSIKLKEKDDMPDKEAARESFRRSYCMAITNGLDGDLLQYKQASLYATLRKPVKVQNMGDGDAMKGRRGSLEDLLSRMDIAAAEEEAMVAAETARFSTVAARGERRSKRSKRRLSIINGHVFNVDTSVFTPAHGSITSVTVSSLDPTPEVIKLLLEKFKVENNPTDFCLCTVKSSGETRVLRETDCPLLERVMLGPLEDDANIFIMDRGHVNDINEEVAQFAGLPDAVLSGFLKKLSHEEDQEIAQVKQLYDQYKKELHKRFSDFHSTQL